jgi:hypothetical protein
MTARAATFGCALVAATLAACSPGAVGGGGSPDVISPGNDLGFATVDVKPTADAAAEVVADAGSEVGPPDAGCAEGKACNDGDPCTFNDQCTAGLCRGTAIDCSDGVPCTEDTCVGGACTNPIAPGFCLLDGACWTALQANPKDGCQRCDPSQNTKQWSANDGFACDDGDPCTGPDQCLAGSCTAPPLACPDDANPCTSAACVAGACQVVPLTGSPCDDGDPCSTGDVCDKGKCAGAVTSCDDGVACTQDACSPGGCVHTVSAGLCAIGGVCYGNGQTNPADACQRCDPAASATSWAGAQNGSPCDDGDPCTWPDACSAGVCSSTKAPCPDDGDPCTAPKCTGGICGFENLEGQPCDDGDLCTVGEACAGGACTGGADSGDPSCQPGEGSPCSYHTDCYPWGVCARRVGSSDPVCNVPCAGEAECAPGQICTKLPGSANVAFCQPRPAGLALGAGCTDNDQCQTRLCSDGVCSLTCLNETFCAGAAATCHPVGDLAIGEISGACNANPGGTFGIGAGCSDSSDCASGHCDLLALFAGFSPACAALCRTKLDCAPLQECNLTFYATKPNPQALEYDPQAPYVLYDSVMACYTPSKPPGNKADATVCAAPSECQSHVCLPLLPSSSNAYCTRHCTTSSQCQSGMVCKTDLVNLVSDWLGKDIGNSPNAWTVVRICKFP